MGRSFPLQAGAEGSPDLRGLDFAGFLIWLAWSPGVAYRLFGVNLPGPPPIDSTLLSLLSVPISCGVLALLTGFAFPGGFFLWGVALGLHGPVADGLTVRAMYQDGLGLYGGARDIAGYAVLMAILFVSAISCYTVLASAGAGARYLAGRLPRR